jgi:hypothetical protein
VRWARCTANAQPAGYAALKDFRFGGARLVRANLDIYNVTNGNPVRAVNAAYASWLRPTSILDARLFKISAQFDF